MFYVYILRSIDFGKIYIGFTKDLEKRVEHHNLGLDNYTKKYLPWKLIFYEAYLSEEDARRREIFLKSGRGREIIKEQLKFSLK